MQKAEKFLERPRERCELQKSAWINSYEMFRKAGSYKQFTAVVLNE